MRNLRTFKNAQEFYDFWVKSEANKEELDEVRGKTAEQWWDVTQRGDMMLHLYLSCVFVVDPTEEARFRSYIAKAYRAECGNPWRSAPSSRPNWFSRVCKAIRRRIT